MPEVTYDQLIAACKAQEEHWNGKGGAWIPEADYSFYDTLTDWVPAFVCLMWLTGGRVSEVLAVRGIDFKFYEKEGREVVAVSLMNLKQPTRSVKESLIVPDQYPEAWNYIDKYQANIVNQPGLWFHRRRHTVWYACMKLFGQGPHRAGRHSWTMEQARVGAQLLDIKQAGGWSALSSMQRYISNFGRDELIGRKLRVGKVL